MAKRPYYLITHTIDCDGYSNYIDYLGTNGQAAIERFKHIVEDIKRRYFLNEGLQEDEIYFSRTGMEQLQNLSLQDIDRPGKCFTLYINDDRTCWITVAISVIETGTFFHYPTTTRWNDGAELWTDNANREVEYLETHPNAKY